MKKLIALMLALFMLAPVYTAEAQNKELQKELKKEYKRKKKEFEKEKWKIFASARTMEVALLLHYEKLNDPETLTQEIVGVANNFKSKNVGRQMAANNACVTYARQAGTYLKGRVVSDISGDGSDADGEFDHFYAAYESSVEKEIKNEMKESFCIIKENKDGSLEMQTFYTVSEDAATKARIRAYENALKESAAAQKYADQVSSFVKEGFPVENP